MAKGTATLMTEVRSADTHQAVYRCLPPLKGNEYIFVSAVDLSAAVCAIDSIFGNGIACCETYIFGCTRSGKVKNWSELPGSIKHIKDHAVALRGAGYEITPKAIQP